MRRHKVWDGNGKWGGGGGGKRFDAVKEQGVRNPWMTVHWERHCSCSRSKEREDDE